MYVGKKIKRVDAFDKVTGRAKFTEDLVPKDAYTAKIYHSTIAHGKVLHIDTTEAMKVPGVVKIVTCFDVPKIQFPTAGHPWSTEKDHQDVADRLLLNEHVRYYGDDVAVVIARDEVACKQALKKIVVEYEEYPANFDALDSIKDVKVPIHEESPDNILKHTTNNRGNFEEAIKEEGLIKVVGDYETPIISHAHLENPDVYAYEKSGKIVVVASTQIPHIIRRVVGQALGLGWGKIRVIKPYIGGGFGNKQDALYEPLCAFLTTQVGGHPVKLLPSREETFVSTRTRHAMKIHIESYVRKNGDYVARRVETYSNGGAYASHGHSIAAKGLNCFHQLYPCENIKGDAYSIYTNLPAGGAMRGYGIPQAMFAYEAHHDDVAKALGMDPLELKLRNVMPKGYVDPFSHNENYYDSFRDCLEKGAEAIDYYAKKEKYKNQTGNIRYGIGCAVYWYNTGVFPISLESSSCRMIVNEDGSVQIQLPETEIGQGADTAFTQMAADSLGMRIEDIHIISTQDTDVSPFGLGAYASRQTYMASFSITKTAKELKEKILDQAYLQTRITPNNLDIVDSTIVRKTDGRKLLTMEELATESLYTLKTENQHITAETTHTVRTNAFSFGASFAEVKVDIDLAKVEVVKLINVHDAGNIINPQLAEAQAHGGMSMAVGFALTEEMKYNDKGRILNNNLLDYKLGTIADTPEFEVYFIENPEPTSPYHTKSLGEPPTCSPAPAIRNAVLNATGISVNKIPMTPHVLFPLFKENGLIDNDL
ncbi:MAG: xanthine dehydrogenase molybdenum-binding subunit XdhA [Anaerococcus sp.]|uniref:xanthine dehydrogenase subunit XdhA n=1 Tax=Anaerococcus sp. TaxID=1872515 RepID=UPI00261C5F29|nr:xanthine dehydrogenase subunit XdhA [Anaerococcus sp.]MCI5972203.1 xanthine dehydrogenase molybdenum-binding subunit XdhA [Anaerococcus sp.]MDD6918299.1 xanthine dehydrogenase molybdenum-binding subunit XdhA [Peptoniphilaceae bacterium]